jgi:hypothetical protein
MYMDGRLERDPVSCGPGTILSASVAIRCRRTFALTEQKQPERYDMRESFPASFDRNLAQ